jgi:hypothetical protein
MLRQRSVMLVAASAFAATVASTASIAGEPHDGVWSVSLITQSGECDPSLASQIQIRDGRINENLLFARIVGNVNGNGAVSLQVVRGGHALSARGKVNGMRASGSWTAPSKNCMGSWTAEKSV